MPRWLKVLLIVGVGVFAGLFFAQEIALVNADLGRHITNGRVFFETGGPISTNFYSYTEPDFRTINHHWGAGVIFYVVWKWCGFTGLSLLSIIVNALAVLMFVLAAARQARPAHVFLLTLLALPLIACRTEVRPEAFSYLLLGVYYYVLSEADAGRLPGRLLWALVPLQVLWVNLHLFFIMGPMIAGAFWLGALIQKQERERVRTCSAVLAALLAASLVSPFGRHGFLEPFMVLREYGYMIVENQSVFFMQHRLPAEPLYYHFELLVLLVVLLFITVAIKSRRVPGIPGALLLLFFIALSFWAVRGIPMFGLFFIPATGGLLQELGKLKLFRSARRKIDIAALGLGVAVMAGGLIVRGHYFSPLKGNWGAGLIEGIGRSGEFVRTNHLQGPFLNNYDIGGYFIFHLYPEHRVFVDNRPEAYSVAFFKEIYKPLQADEGKWRELDRRYGFNCIYFFRLDDTQHAQPFLFRRIKDPAWAPVYVDGETIILLKRNEVNAELIRRFELPPEMFRSET
jgi:hypothetical protein